MHRIHTLFIFIFVLLVSILFLGLSIKGDAGTPLRYQYEYSTKRGGPFESSNSNARYALTQAIVENKSFSLSDQQARFASPDLVYHNGKFYSIFTPGISFIGVPFYMIGKAVHIPQIATYLSTAIFALLNLFLVAALARKLGARKYASILAGYVFLFATNALAYAHSLTQHHLSTTLILLALLNAFGKRTVIKNILFGAIVGLALLVDIPNIFLLAPIGLFLLAQHIHTTSFAGKITYTIQTNIVALALGLLPFLALFAFYNYNTTGSYTKLGQTIGRMPYEYATGAKVRVDTGTQAKSTFPFKTRNQIGGMYTLLVSDERSWLFYSPVILLGIAGIFSLYKQKEHMGETNVIVAFIAMNILLYSMFGDPWGGWAFGPRYLIPAAAGLCAMLAVALTRYLKNIAFGWLFLITLTYSIFVSVAGALTTSSIPPQQEAINLLKPIPHTYAYNLDLIAQGSLSSLAYNTVFKDVTNASTYVFVVGAAVIACSSFLFALTTLEAMRKEKLS